jgi:hypothetical protein
MHERQAVVFGVLLAGLAVVGLGAAAVYTGSINAPFLARGFDAAPTPTVTQAAYPCPPAGATPLPFNIITVNVYNGTSRAGLAAATLAEFTQRGFVAGKTANAGSYSGVALIQFGSQGIAAAYTVAAEIQGAQMKYDARTDTTVDVLMGDAWTDLVSEDAVKLDPSQPIPAPSTCTPLDRLTPAKATPTPTTTAKPAKKK